MVEQRHDVRRPLLVSAIGAVVLGVSMALASTGPPGSAEVAVFRWFNDPPRVLDAVLGLVDPLLRPLGLVIVVAVVLVLLVATRRHVARQIVLAAGCAGVLGYLLSHFLKLVVDRGRPPTYLDDVLFHGYPVSPLGTGFPSTHTSVVVAVVVGAWPWLDRRWRVGGVVLATAVGLDRMYVGAHFPLDIVGGVGVGLVAGGVVQFGARWTSDRRGARPSADRPIALDGSGDVGEVGEVGDR